jgi:hypothetical protein
MLWYCPAILLYHEGMKTETGGKVGNAKDVFKRFLAYGVV